MKFGKFLGSVEKFTTMVYGLKDLFLRFFDCQRYMSELTPLSVHEYFFNRSQAARCSSDILVPAGMV